MCNVLIASFVFVSLVAKIAGFDILGTASKDVAVDGISNNAAAGFRGIAL